ncbi:50S ribosomal protein L2 [Candidatus Hydrogenosomobacter endosymbioticus]|uniref:Large ribosomal subunit protein uL2 n=1 Tax=Candidatus Hydrogenosomobacter endosymbioticus TaxID=2558174 RepID=A0ABM7V8X7_9PROT|nr:50S ribosomal protein L2 [Candidatus Hydrogenosomobacter endosymbioticus]BDB95943.1 50S ribosomal protein L2 [Candidatus Hydrogenosomobacter endosymbioticus]
MALIAHNPTTSSRRGLVTVDRSGLWKGGPCKKLCVGLKKTGGRSRSSGRLTARHRGGGHKRIYRIVDFKRRFFDVPAVVERIEYDPSRSAFIALIKYESGEVSYILAPQKVVPGDKVVSGEDVPVKDGNAMVLRNIPVGTVVHNVELKKGKGGQMARSAGTSVQVVGHDGGYALLRLPSGEVRKVSDECMATVGVLSNEDNKNRSLAKAGRSRWIGRRPHVRGVAMNPVDHPLGGGEGKTSGGRHPVSPQGQCAKGLKTRSKKKTSGKLIVRKRK